MFNDKDVTTICNLPLSLFGARDKITWWLVGNEIFSIKSAYALEIDRERKVLSETSNPKSKEVF